MAAESALPPASKLMPAVLKALEASAGVASNEEIERFVVADLGLAPEQAGLPRSETGRRTELGYRIAWARTRLRQQGRIVRKGRGRWSLASWTGSA